MNSEKITVNRTAVTPRQTLSTPGAGRIAISSVAFGSDTFTIHPKSNQRIDDDVYYLIRSTPKVLQHDHYNGSMPLSLVKWSLIRDILKGRREGEIGDLSLEELRKEYRISRSMEYAKNMRPDAYKDEDASQVIDETRRNGDRKAGEDGEADGSHGSAPVVDTSGLGRYRVAYDKIPKLIKSVHYAYMGALEYTHKMANHNVRYFELRTNPIPAQEVDKPDGQIINGIYNQLGKSADDVMASAHANGGRLPAPLMSAIRQEMDNVNENLIRKVQERVWKEKGTDETLADLIAAIKQDLETTPEDLIQSIQMGIDDAREDIRKSRKEIDYGLILLAYRHGSNAPDPETGRPARVEKAMEVARIAIDLKKKGYKIAGIDLAGSEAPYPVTDFEPFFNLIHEYNSGAEPEKRIGITIHAGETRKSGVLEGWESVREAVRIGSRPYTPLRIGHGVEIMKESQILQDAFAEFKLNPDSWVKKYPPEKILKESPVLREIIEKGIALEMCIKSNKHTGIIPFHTEHPALFLSRLGAKVTVNTDNMIVDNTDPTNEFVKLYKYQDMRHEDRVQVLKNGLETAFIFDPVLKKAIMDDVARNIAYIDRNSTMQLGMYKERNDEMEPSPFKTLKIELLCHFRAVIQSLLKFIDRIRGDLEHYLDLKPSGPRG